MSEVQRAMLTPSPHAFSENQFVPSIWRLCESGAYCSSRPNVYSEKFNISAIWPVSLYSPIAASNSNVPRYSLAMTRNETIAILAQETWTLAMSMCRRARRRASMGFFAETYSWSSSKRRRLRCAQKRDEFSSKPSGSERLRKWKETCEPEGEIGHCEQFRLVHSKIRHRSEQHSF